MATLTAKAVVGEIRAALNAIDAARLDIDLLNAEYNGVANWPDEAKKAWQTAMFRLLDARDRLTLEALRKLVRP